jgi:hexosaminidase
VTGTQTIKCTTYRAGRQMGKTLTLPLVWNKATAKPVLGNTQAGKILVNGIRGSLRQSDFEWHSWESSDSVAFTIDLQKKESLRSVSVGCITNYGMAAHKPADIEVWVSNDNRDYRKVSGKQFTDGEIFREGTFKEDVVLDLNKEIGRYVRIIAKGAGECPATHVRPGQEARIYFDEVMIE